MTKYIILTNKGYICEKNEHGEYSDRSNEFYRRGGGMSGYPYQGGVDRLGFTDDETEATRYCANIGNRVQEIADRIEWGFEDIYEIKIIVGKEVSEIKPYTGCDNMPYFCFNDNAISLWEIYWNFNEEDDCIGIVEVIGNTYENPELLEGGTV